MRAYRAPNVGGSAAPSGFGGFRGAPSVSMPRGGGAPSVAMQRGGGAPSSIGHSFGGFHGGGKLGR